MASEEGEGEKRHNKGVDRVEQTNPGATRYEMTGDLGAWGGCGVGGAVDVKFG